MLEAKGQPPPYSLPWWVGVLQAAKDWGCHPEEVMKRSALWILRYNVLNTEIARGQRDAK